jgi:hypothetical protein
MKVFVGGCCEEETIFDQILTTENSQGVDGFDTVLIDENGNVLTMDVEDLT